jgi:hypothetical protein
MNEFTIVERCMRLLLEGDIPKFFETAGSNTLAMGLHYFFLAGLA